MLRLTSAMLSMSMGRDPASRHHMWVGYALLLMVVVTSVKEVLEAKAVLSIVACHLDWCIGLDDLLSITIEATRNKINLQ